MRINSAQRCGLLAYIIPITWLLQTTSCLFSPSSASFASSMLNVYLFYFSLIIFIHKIQSPTKLFPILSQPIICYFVFDDRYLYFVTIEKRQQSILLYQLMSSEEKESIMALPLAERVVAVALKHVFDQIKKIAEEEGEESHNVIFSFTNQFRQIQKKASKVIKGGEIPESDLKYQQKYFTEEEAGKINQLAKDNKPIKHYWKTVLENFFQESFTEVDKEISKAISDISTNVTEEKLQVIIELGQNEWLKEGKIVRSIFLIDGQPAKAESEGVSWLKKKPEGTLASIIDGGNSQEDVITTFPFIGEIVNDLIPYSLQFYLGVDEGEDVEEVDDEESDEEEEMEGGEDSGTKKKVKE